MFPRSTPQIYPPPEVGARLLSLAILAALAMPASRADALPRSEPEPEIRRFLQQYTGSWTGQLVLRNPRGEILREFPTAAEYWWRGSELMALSTFDLGTSLRVVRSRNYFRNGLLFADVEEEDHSTVFRGFLENGTLHWIPYDAVKNTERRLRERFETNGEGETVLVIEGGEIIREGNRRGTVHLEARLIKKGER